MKILSFILLLCTVTLLNAQEAYDKQFIKLINAEVKDGNISSIAKVGCKKGDCRIDKLTFETMDEETGEKSKIAIDVVKLYNVKGFMEFKERNGALKKGESRHFSLELKDIQEDGHNLFFDKPKMAAEFGEKSELYNYFKKYLDTPTDGSYSLSLKKKGQNVVVKDKGLLSTGKFSFALNSQYTIKGGLEKLDESAQKNPMGMMALIVINAIDIKIENPKGFLKNLMYINYKNEMREAASKEEREAINKIFYLSGSELHSQKQFSKQILANMHTKMKSMKKTNPVLNTIMNKKNQLENKLHGVLSGTSNHIYVKIENPKALSIGDLFGLVMGYSMQQKLTMDPGIKVTIQ